MQSFVETVDTVECSQAGPDGFRSLRAYRAVFNIQGPQEYLADISDGCQGPLRARWGRRSPAGEEYVGL